MSDSLFSHRVPQSLVYAIYFYPRTATHRYLHSFPTRRSSDLDEPPLDRLPLDALHVEAGAVVGDLDVDLAALVVGPQQRSEEHTSELQSRPHIVCRLLLEKKKIINIKLYMVSLFNTCII